MTVPADFRIRITADAASDLQAVTDRRSLRAIAARIDALATAPQQQGKALTGPLRGYRSVRAAGQRYRIVYRVSVPPEAPEVTVVVIGIRREGHRTDAYRVAQRRL